ncbi:FHA domain-containing protein [Agrococcus beijingensis]|uniref:FHA domain-containing protein n=1 Tax=Agrococcus beijingensis TaxID=3068634 RepID=UPI002741A370|nr:FHA domain-containing protein [Agrococcus sp. REN33]
MSARIEYAPGEAWCVAAGRTVLVCERDLTPARARALHATIAAVASTDALREVLDGEPSALIGLVDLSDGRVLLRRHGVPATADGSGLPDRFGADWSLDEISADGSVAAGGLGSLDGETLPFEGGVVRVSAVRVAPGRADASTPSPAPVPVSEMPAEEPRFGTFGQTLPPAAAADARAAASAPGADVSPELVPTVPEPEPVAVTRPVAVERALESTPGVSDTGSPIGGLIDSVPGFIKPAADVRELQPEAPVAPAASPPAPEPAPAAGDFGDHDGLTITAEQARRLHAERAQRAGAQPPEEQDAAPTAAAPTAAAPATGPLVLSTLCPNGHVNAPGTTTCIRCGSAIDEGSAAQRRRPEVAVAVLVSGERIPLGRGVVIGRRPRSRRVEDGRVPRLITVDSPGEDISRSHLELRVDDWNLVAVDLSSTNGTLLLREGSAPQRLRPEASTILQLGDRLDLGDGQVVTIESAP